jgi:RNA polymerase sigma factor (sigma-70 family)
MKSSLFFLHSDAKILDLLRKREDAEGLMMLYKANRREVTAYVVNNSGTSEEAEDMLQEAVVVLWEKVRSGDFQYQAKLSTFVLAIVKNMWRRHLARRRREVPQGDRLDMAQDGNLSPLDALIESERARLVRGAMKKLGDPCKKLLLLFYWEERSLEEIAAIMGFANADTVKSKKYQCKKVLESLILRMK